MNSLLDALGVTTPVLAAPMAGGATTTALVVAAARGGGLGFVPAGYVTARTLAERVAAARAERIPFGVNVFAPNPLPVDRAAFDRYAALLRATADQHHVDLSGHVPVEDDDAFAEKIGLLAEDPVPVVSFTFGIPERAVVARLRRAGSLVAQTVTGVEEARAGAEAGVDVLVVQAAAAGGHSGTLTPRLPPPDRAVTDLIAMVRRAVDLPLIAAGGLATPEDVAHVMAAGAQAAMVGTVLLRTGESGASPVHQAALADPTGRGTVLTRAFTGRPARALRNRFTDLYGDHAPYGYPALHHLTGPLRKRAAAAGDAGTLHLWAGTGHRRARREGAGQTLARLSAAL
ncbi:nitronate monooxygenase [Streptomyces fagopyri]|uniref:nitronate monooxygenase n=1 Tax=Streptomyces fagopyri TaxID=2662397 RepID=UPI003720155A